MCLSYETSVVGELDVLLGVGDVGCDESSANAILWCKNVQAIWKGTMFWELLRALEGMSLMNAMQILWDSLKESAM